ncbi:MAG: hypothetical protein C5B53_04120 [Candidatus Melainabacteria bacterium]|nr:MAG: hypothetical protein C5B53_04120 [Candidatus Melainabacteria bacterium]
MRGVFNYLKEEQDFVIANLRELVKNLPDKNREEVFDEVKLICDKLRGYFKKQSSLLLDELENKGEYSGLIKKTKKTHDRLFDDLENLVMIHVDEPGYRSYLANLLKDCEIYFSASDELFAKLAQTLPKPALKRINEKLSKIIHSDVGFNALQAPDVQSSQATRQS